MTTIVTADVKGRIPIRGSKPGRRYIVSQAGGEWRVTACSTSGIPSRNQREWAGTPDGASLWDCLKAMGDSGLKVEKSEIAGKSVPPCRL